MGSNCRSLRSVNRGPETQWSSRPAHMTQSVNNSLSLCKNMFDTLLVQLTKNKPNRNFQQHNFVTSEKMCPRNICRPPLRLLPIKETMRVCWTTSGREIGVSPVQKPVTIRDTHSEPMFGHITAAQRRRWWKYFFFSLKLHEANESRHDKSLELTFQLHLYM